MQLPHEHISYALPVVRTKDMVAFPDGAPEQLLCAALATAHLADYPSTLTLHSHPFTPHTRTIQERAAQAQSPPTPPTHHPDPATIRAWRLTAGHALPLTASQASDLARTTPTNDDPTTPPEPSTQYADAFPLTTQPP